MRRRLVPSPGFLRAARRAARKDVNVANAIRETLERLEADAFDPRLATHKLKGKLSGYLASSAGYDLRLVFQIVKDADTESVLLTTVGTHDEVY